MMVIGGWHHNDGLVEEREDGWDYDAVTSVLVYDPSKDAWGEGEQQLPSPRENLRATVERGGAIIVVDFCPPLRYVHGAWVCGTDVPAGCPNHAGVNAVLLG